jgi:hypothetical protein
VSPRRGSRRPAAYLAAAIATILLVLFGIVLGKVALVIVGVAVGLFVAGIAAMGATQNRVDNSMDHLSPESRILVHPLKRIYNEMQEAARGKSENISSYLAEEALAESKRLLDQSIAALLLRDKLIREGRGRYEANKSVEDLQTRMNSSTSDEEKASLQSALAARQQEISHYDSLLPGISKIESSVKQAEAAMAEMRARMISSSSTGLAEQGSDPLREAVGRMQALSSSLSEAQDMLQR